MNDHELYKDYSEYDVYDDEPDEDDYYYDDDEPDEDDDDAEEVTEPTPGSILYARILRKQLDLQTTMLRHILANIEAGKSL